MMDVRSRSHAKDRAFTLAVWQRGSPTPGTSAIVADATGPGVDSAEPAAARVLRITPKRDAIGIAGAGGITIFALGGTSVVYQAFYYDTTLSKWQQFGARITATTGATNSVVTTRAMYGAKFYLQIITVNGTVTEFGYDYL